METLTEYHVPVIAYDALALQATQQVLRDRSQDASTLERCLKACDWSVLMTPAKEFRQIPFLINGGGPKGLIEC